MFNPFGGGSGGGAPGHDGNGIVSIVFVSSTGGDTPGIEGATDTYQINYTDAPSTTYTVTNGSKGSQGPAGQTGAQGVPGPTGPTGPAGPEGPAGADGKDGKDGTDGADGNGIVSIIGPVTVGLVDTYTITFTNGDTSTFAVTNGANGTNGTNGTDGQDGAPGQDGQDGAPGADGASAYDIWIAAGNVGTEAEFLASLIGAAGQDGSDGADGRGIVSIAKTGTLDNVDTYTITYTSGASSTFTVTNGSNGTNGTGGQGVQNYFAAKARYSNTDYTHNNTNYFATFLHITDIHDDAIRYERAREIADYLKVDGVLMTGDIVAGVGTDDFSFVTDIEASFSTPLYTSVGNHDRYGLDEDTAFTKYYSLFANRYDYKTIAGTSGMNYYVDLADKKLRIISLNLYGYVDGSTVKGHYPHYRQDYIIALTSMLNSTPTNYGVIIICHAPEKGLNRSYDYDIFKQPETFFWTNGSEYTTLTEIVDAFISRSSISKTHINTMTDNSSITVNADFSSVNSGVEFIGWVTGHTHTDNIAYVPNTANKQLMLNMACSGLQQDSTYDINYYNDLGRDEYCETQDLLNAYIIDRENKVVKVVRIGAHLTYDLVDRNYMAIPYADQEVIL